MTKIIAILATHGVEEVELLKPWRTLKKAGFETVLVAPEKGRIQSMRGDIKPRKKYKANVTLEEAGKRRFDGLVLPGGTVNADTLRGNPSAIAFVRKFVQSEAPIAVICHGAWILIEAEGVKSRQMTSWPTLRTELVAAGARWKDEALVEDQNMISSRDPDDLEIFCDALLRQYERPTPKAQPQRKPSRAVPSKAKQGATAEKAKARPSARTRKSKSTVRPAAARQGA
ncbi:type 1 glutamine amidotransferase [Candidatus Kirkpatrickella diaphorinae]|uniref:Type 1 glutamine amidotransferase n=1 Tax=Candidatus Kirkpatrickella diaphorinae TaxID=2984322 RepID=A0ABY6GJ48_9PROT|nr:type 1 glutamine amidotransferase domain-containing protein [Candidatus Kirkpatrickella diaphorinae]UYH51450.1 type 1 glutamine amidotransferase [Candidatus Kirkpatrickella diaphorinae]